MVALKIISPSFPARVAALSAIDIKDHIFEQFPKVFNDQLNEHPMNTEPVEITLKSKAIPFRISVARQIPLRFVEPVENAVQELLKKGLLFHALNPLNGAVLTCFFL